MAKSHEIECGKLAQLRLLSHVHLGAACSITFAVNAHIPIDTTWLKHLLEQKLVHCSLHGTVIRTLVGQCFGSDLRNTVDSARGYVMRQRTPINTHALLQVHFDNSAPNSSAQLCR
jgi:hypothetical protein